MTETRRFDAFRDRLEGAGAESAPPKDPATPDVPESPDTPEGGPETEPEAEEESSMTTDTPLEERDDYKAGLAAGQKAATDRMNAVFAHADCKGRETHAARLLGRSMSSDEIIAELPNYPAASALSEDEQRRAAEEGGRAQMREEMELAGTADLGAAEEPNGKTGRAKADAVWDRANAAVGRTTTKQEG